MKKVIKKAVMLTIVVFLFACSKDEKSVADQLSELKSVSFPEKPDKKDCITMSAEKPKQARSLSSSRVMGPVVSWLPTVVMRGSQ